MTHKVEHEVYPTAVHAGDELMREGAWWKVMEVVLRPKTALIRLHNAAANTDKDYTVQRDQHVSIRREEMTPEEQAAFSAARIERQVIARIETAQTELEQAYSHMVERAQGSRFGGDITYKYGDPCVALMRAQAKLNLWRFVEQIREAVKNDTGEEITWAEAARRAREHVTRQLWDVDAWTRAESRSTSQITNLGSDIEREAAARFVRDVNMIVAFTNEA